MSRMPPYTLTPRPSAGDRSACQVKGQSALIAVRDEPPPRLIVDPPLAGPLARGKVFIQYRTENMRIVPVFGEQALLVSPRVGHVHVTVDDGPWHFVDASGETIVVVGLEPGEHQVLIELAQPDHHVVDRKLLGVRIPERPVPDGNRSSI